MSKPFLQRIGVLTLGSLLLLAGLCWSLRADTEIAAAQDHTQKTPASSTAGTARLFHAALSGANENPAVVSKASGYAILALSDDGSTLSYRVLTSDLISLTNAHIHVGAVGQNGGVIEAIAIGAGGAISGVVTLTPSEVADLQAGNYYINLHTSKHGGGEIRGQITSFTPPSAFSALLSGAGEVPPVPTGAVGVGHFTLVNTDTLSYTLVVSNITAIGAAHIHQAPPGVNGAPVHFIYTGTGAFDPANPLSGTVELDAQGMVDLLTGYYYVNVHTASQPGGEIRGQIGGATLFGAQLDGNQEAPPVKTLAYGAATLGLSADAATLVYRLAVDEIQNVSAAHIHRGALGQAGDVEFGLPSLGSGSVISGSIPVSDVHVLRLISGHYYFNVHTTANGGGEIRGQVEPLAAPTRFSAVMTSAEQGGAAATAGAAGFVRFKLHPLVNVLDYYMAVTNTTSAILASHIHKGAVGVNNPTPTFPLADGTTLAPGKAASGALLLDATHLVDLLTGYYYANVHTANNPSGEMRGQIGGARVYGASMDGTQETPVRGNSAFGLGIFGLAADLGSLAYRVFSNGLPDVTLSHIHVGKPGVAGPAEFTLFRGQGIFDAAHPISGTLTFTDSHVLRLVSGLYYVNTHTATLNNSGATRGQLQPLPTPRHFNALLNGAEQVPPVTTTAAGVARLYLEPLANLLHYHIAVTNTTPITGAHIHKAPLGVSVRTPEINLYGGGNFDNDHPLVGNVRLNAQHLVDLWTGYFYINLHNAAHPAGEVRGQIRGAHTYAAQLNGASEVPAVTTAATGRALLAVSADGKRLAYRISVAAIDKISAAHIHVGQVGQNGPPVATLYNGSGPFSPTQPISGAVVLGTSDLQNLAAGNFYINIHTQDFPNGEVRGQVARYTPTDHFQSLLTTEPPLPTAAATLPAPIGKGGLTSFQLRTMPALLQYRLDVADVVSITLAHIHKAPLGSNGPPIVTLYNGTGAFGPDQPLGGMVTLDAERLVDLLTNYYYVNIHTVSQPGGAVRGQIEEDGAFYQIFLPFAQPRGLVPTLQFNIVVVSRCERQPAGTWFEGTTYINGAPSNGHLVAFSFTADGPIVAKIQSGPHQGYPGWKTGYYSHIISAPTAGPRAGSWYVWIVDAQDKRISEIGVWQSTGPGEGCNQAVVDFDSRQ